MRHGILALAVAGAQILGCSGCSQGSDAAPDASPHDAGVDAAVDNSVGDSPPDVLVDSPFDAAKDVGKEASLEAGVDEGTWVDSPYSGFLGCVVEQPADLATVTPASWLSCPGGLTGCLLLDTAYLPGSYGMVIAHVAPVGQGASPMFAVLRGLGGKISSPTVFQAGSGPALASWRFSASCALYVFALSATEAALLLSPREDLIAQNDVRQRIALGTPGALMSAASETYDLPYSLLNANGARVLSASATLLAIVVAPSGRMVVASRPNGKVSEVPIPGGAGNAQFGTPVVVGADVVVDLMGVGGDRLVVRHANEVVENLRYDPNRTLAMLGGDGEWLAWQEGFNGTANTGFANVELWAGKPDGNPATFAPIKVADLPYAETDSHMTVTYAYGEGWYLFQVGLQQLRATRISDGKHADIAPPEGYAFIKPLRVAGGDAWMLLRKSSGSPDPITIERLALGGLALQ